jgi:predicted dehydrogenase
MAAQKPLGIGVVGTGGWARSFWESAETCSEVRLVACWNRTAERAQAFAQRFGCEVAPTLEDLVSRPDVDAIANFGSNNFHRHPTELAAAAGKHVFVDKPIANTIEDSVAMIRACQKAGVVLMVGHSTRYRGQSRALKQLLDSGRLGLVAMAEANMSHSGGARLTADEWRWHREEAPGGPLIQLAIHSFDTLHYFFGPTRRVSAFSTSSLLPSEIEDVFLSLLEFESGLLAYVGTNYVSSPIEFVRVYGKQASAYWEEAKLTLASTPEEPWSLKTEEPPIPPIKAPAAEMSEFARAIRTSTAPETGGKEGLLALGVVWACLESAQEGGRPVEVRAALGQAASLLD